jgi:hypothetical protein
MQKITFLMEMIQNCNEACAYDGLFHMGPQCSTQMFYFLFLELSELCLFPNGKV